MSTMEEKVASTLKQLHDNHPHAENPSMEKYFACFTPNARFLGTQAGDNWNMTEYKRYLVPMYNSGRQIIPIRPQEGSRKISVSPPFASFDEVLLGCDAGGALRSELRGSGSMVYDGAQQAWRIALYHLSVPIPNDAALAVSQSLPQPHPFPQQQQQPPPAPPLDTAPSSSSSSSSKKKKSKKAKK
jgi:hypothetical protein